jgi:Mycolic acid cyclopropane synthetase
MVSCAETVTTARELIETLGAELRGRQGVHLEFSLRMQPGILHTSGRFGCWLNGEKASDFEPITRVLRQFEAPGTILDAQRSAEGSVRQSIAVGFSEGVPELRLYLHGRTAGTLADHYRAWRWRPGAAPRSSSYSFHFLPETAAGERPLMFVDRRLRPAVASLLTDKRLQQASGFWLRRGPTGRIEQLDLPFPWYPLAGSLPGLLELTRVLALPAARARVWRDLAIRHVAIRIGSAIPEITLYASAPFTEPWPGDEAALQEQVRRNARALHDTVEETVYRNLPNLPAIRAGRTELDKFYDAENVAWQAILGPELHYHAGLFETPQRNADDAAMNAALRRAVTELYPFIPARGRIYDIGCGWGAPLGMWVRDLRCPSLGLTNSRAQFRHVAALGLPVRWGNAECTLPPGHFDCAVLLESLSHIRDKVRLLRVLRRFADCLVMRVNCQDGSQPGPAFGGTMQMITSTQLREVLQAAGWRVRHWRNRRDEAMPSVDVWHRRLQSVPVSGDHHLETLRAWTARVIAAPAAWAYHNPLIEVVAD